MENYRHAPVFSLGEDKTVYRKIIDLPVGADQYLGRKILPVKSQTLQELAHAAFSEISFYFRSSHLNKMAAILDDDESSANDRFVAASLLKNAIISAEGVLPSCQDTGTATIMAHRGYAVFSGPDDIEALSRGVYETYRVHNLRYSQISPTGFFEEVNTGDNMPAQIDIYSVPGNEYHFLFVAKGGGSSNKTMLYQESKALLNPEAFENFLREKLSYIGVAACPPYHLAVVVGGTSPEWNLKTVKLASAGALDDLPTEGGDRGAAYRDLEMEKIVMKVARETGLGAQFGGKHFALDARVIRAVRHAGSCPVGIGVSCSADRNIKGKITLDGVFLEELDHNPARFLPKIEAAGVDPAVKLDLSVPMDDLRAEISKHPVGTRFSLNGSLIVARDMAHAKIKEIIDSGEGMPEYFRKYCVYYAGPAKTPEGMASGSFGPTTAQRMDGYVDEFMSLGGSMVMLAKGNRSAQVTDACKKHGGFYLGTIGGAAALLAHDNITKSEVLAFDELGMESVRLITVEDLPAFLLVDDKGNTLYD